MDVEPEPLWKERPQRAVRQPGRNDRRLARASLTAHERAGDLARRVELLLVVAREREPVDSLARLLRHHRGAQDDRVALPQDYSAVRLLGHPAGLDRKPLIGHLNVLRDYCHSNTSM